MEATGRDGGGRRPWSYRELSGISSSYTISSTSGTTVSTGYTSTGSHLSWISMEAATHFQEMEGEITDEFVQPVKKSRKQTEKQHTECCSPHMERIKRLVKEFFGAPSAKCSIEGGDMSVLDRWLTELGVGWVLHLADGAPAGKLEKTLDAPTWIWALIRIMGTIRLATSLFPDHGSVVERRPAIESDEQDMTFQFQFASFTQQAMLKMLTFVDVLAATNLSCGVSTEACVPAPFQKLYALLRVRETLSNVLVLASPSEQVGRILGEIVISILSAKEAKAGEAVWGTMQEIRTRTLEYIEDSDDDLPGTQTAQGSSGIHKAIRSVIGYIRFLETSSVDPIVSEAVSLGKYVPQIVDVPPLTSLVMEMMSCIQGKLVNKSEKIADQSLRFLFLLNNSFSITDLIHHCTSYFPEFPESYKASFTGKVEGYMETYIQVSWAPVLACLSNPKPLRLFGKNYSTLLKFESEFQKTYNTQKLWKVPDPKLRKILREAIIVKIVPSYTKYIEHNNVATPQLTPQNLEEMLQEMFEG